MSKIILYYLVGAFLLLSSCESDSEKRNRIQHELESQIELEKSQKEKELQRLAQEEKDRIKMEQELERERKEKEVYDKYISNSLRNGATPYAYCYNSNSSCVEYGCSQIKVKTPHDSDVLVTIKQGDLVVSHAYIQAGDSYIFELPNGTYKPFFYYGKGWNPNKVMKESACGTIKGGFMADEHFGKDDEQFLSNNILEYTLILQQDGNFSTIPSNQNDAL